MIEGGYIRPSWDEYFMEICRVVAKRATCDRGRTACVIVKDKHILVTGYVGSAKGLPHCDEVGHQMEDTIHEDGVKRGHCVRTSHAEQNAICQAAKLGISIDGSTVYCKLEPCPVCAKMIINCGIKRVVCEKRYQSGAQSLLEQAGVKVEVLIDEVEEY
ncbi:MAG: cytidine/deoxycytidylate deaminase family protein [archaeon]